MKKRIVITSKQIGIVLILFTIISLSVGTYLYLNNPKIRFINLMNKEYKSLIAIIDEIQTSELAVLKSKNTFTSTGSVDFDFSAKSSTLKAEDLKTVAAINDLLINYKYESDINAGKAKISLNSKIGATDFISADFYQLYNKNYYYLKDIYDKYIQSDEEITINDQNKKINDYLYISKRVQRSIAFALKTSDFKASKQEITINGKKVKTDKIALLLNEERIRAISIRILTDLKNDSSSIKILTEYDKTAKKDLESIIKSIGSDNNETQMKCAQEVGKAKCVDSYVENDPTPILILNVFARGNEVDRINIFGGKNKISEYTNYIDTNPIHQFDAYANNEVMLTAKLEPKTANDVKYSISAFNKTVKISGNVTKNIIHNPKDKSLWTSAVSFDMTLSATSNFNVYFKTTYKDITKIGTKISITTPVNVIKNKDISASDQEIIRNKIIDKLKPYIPVTPLIMIPSPGLDNNQITY